MAVAAGGTAAAGGGVGGGTQRRATSDESANLLKGISNLMKAYMKAGHTAEEFGDILNKALKKSGSSINSLKRSLNSVRGSFEDIRGEIEKMGVEKGLSPNKVKELLKISQDLEKKAKLYHSDLEDILRSKKYINASDAEQNVMIEEHLAKIYEIKKAQEDLLKVTEGFSKTGPEMFGEFEHGLGTLKNFKGVFSGSVKDMHTQATNSKEVGENLSRWGGNLAKAKGLMGALGKAMQATGGTIGKISTSLLGWQGIVSMVVVKAAEMFMKMDGYLKDINKGFAAIRGPDIMTKDVYKQFQDFNKQIFDVAENLKVGFSADQIREFFSAVSMAGLRVQELNSQTNNYRDAVDVAAKASRTLGLELPAVGAAMAELSTEFKMDLEDMDHLFVQIAFDAGKSGLTTEKFLGAVKNASVGLAFYGKFAESASQAMRALTESQIMGASEAAEATHDMFQVFKTNSLEANAALIEFMGKGKVDKAFKDFADKASIEVNLIQEKIDKGGTADQIQKLRSEMSATAGKAKLANELAGKSSIEQASYLEMIAKDAPELLSDLVVSISKGTSASEMTQEQVIVAIKALGQYGLKPEMVKELIQYQRDAQTGLEQIYGVTGDTEIDNKGFYSSMLKANASQAATVANGLKSLKDISDPKEMDAAVAQQTDVLSKIYGVEDKTISKAVVESAAASPEFNDALQEILKEAASGNFTSEQIREKISKQLKATKAGEKRGIYQYKHNSEAQQTIADNAAKTADNIVDQTLSVEEAAKIAGDGLRYNTAQVLGINRIAVGTTNIIRLLAKQFRKKTPEEEDARKNLSKIAESAMRQKGVFDKYVKSHPVGSSVATVERSKEKFLFSEALALQRKSLTMTDDEKKLAEADLKRSGEIVEYTKTIMKNDEGYAKDMMSSVMGNKEATDAVVAEISDVYRKGKTISKEDLDDLLRKKYLDPDAETVKNAINAMWSLDSSGVYTKKMQGIQTPQMVTDPGAVVLHPKEMILPADYSGFKARPLGDAGTTAMGGTTTKNFNIVVNATETNLATRIANEIRAYVYKESLTEVTPV